MKKFCLFLLISSKIFANMAPEGFERFPNNYFVETGTYLGQGIRFALRAGFPKIYSVEIDHRYAVNARSVFSNKNNVQIFEGDSGKMLWNVIKDINESITFWLDGHSSIPDNTGKKKNTPLLQELEQIKMHNIKNHTILIDDMHCCGKIVFDYITKEQIVNKILEINPNYVITFIPGGDAGEYTQNIMVAMVPDKAEHEKVFSWIYDKAVWGKNDRGQGFSGGGSLLENTKEYIAYIEKFMKDHNIKSVIDAGCGDWEFSKYMDWSGVNYIGYDVVGSVIEENKKTFSLNNVKFVHENFLLSDLPSADLFICKHVFQHLRNSDIIKFSPQLKKFKYCLITNEVDPGTLSSLNIDIAIGGGHKIDLGNPPFNIKGEKVLNYKVYNSIHQVYLIDNTK